MVSNPEELARKIKLIKEQREAEAIKKNLPRKLRALSDSMGYEIRSEQGEYGCGIDQNYWPEDWEWQLPDEAEENEEFDLERMPVADISSEVIGYCYDGLSIGFHFELKHLLQSNEIQAYYQGKMVYHEIGGELHCYVPMKEWEDRVEKLCEHLAVRIQEKEKPDLGLWQRRMQQIKDYLKEKWGV